MSDTADLGLQFAGVFVASRELAVVLAVVPQLADENVDHTLVYYRYSGVWYLYKTDRPIVSVCFPSGPNLEVALLSAYGEVVRLRAGTQTIELLDTRDDGPSDLVVMRHVMEVAGVQFAVGMARLAYRKSPGAADWERIDATCFLPRDKRTYSAGFYSAAAFSPQELYAVGYKGEIWKFDGFRWSERPSPTNVVLTSVACDLHNGRVVAAGLAGTILIGRDDRWIEMQQAETKADFWGATYFDRHVYLASNDGVFRVVDLSLQRVDLGQLPLPSTSFISAREDTMWSAGARDLYETLDGTSWHPIPNP